MYLSKADKLYTNANNGHVLISDLLYLHLHGGMRSQAISVSIDGMSYENILTTMHDNVALITLNRPKVRQAFPLSVKKACSLFPFAILATTVSLSIMAEIERLMRRTNL